ncbi:MAG: sugar phosphate nucleotidyltransferase [archaeon]
MANIIPMAGEGTRFVEAGYDLPKPLIPVSGKPMILRVVENLPETDKWIFLVRKEHIDEHEIDKILKDNVPGAIIVPVEETTEGQASTCMLAMPHLEPDEPMFIASCDNSFLYDKKKYVELTQDESVDAIIWTFTQSELLREKPESWGWVVLGEKNEVKDMSVKTPVSDNPFNDHAVVGTFYFKRAGDFEAAYNMMVEEKFRVNNEFYVDSIPKFYNKMGKKSIIFDVELYVGWGKPKDLKEYEKIELEKDKPLIWKRYFEQLEDLNG